VRLNGLSWSSNEDKVVKFFSSCKIVPNGLHILLEDNSKPSGDAYIEFETPGDCAKALEKNNQYLDNRYLIITKIKKSEM
ncbi:hypothetical protein HELRODRAFT_127244, partial [Helobdella robusta]|uniref:RRM domain-containing protein n=1 Tax=Helobdella robusta TaxID=6412 RepID=T1EHD3_HELRO